MATKKEENIAIAVDASLSDGSTTNDSQPTKKYPTEMMRSCGFNVCDKCGAQYQNDMSGQPVCPEQDKECPRTK